jgi:hypothetical protein
VLRALGLAGHDDAGRDVGDADRRVGLVDVLAARARRAIGVDAQVGSSLISISIVVVDHRIDPDRREARCAAARWLSKGEMRTSRCTPLSVFSQP